jgi:hypothetical protein
MSKPKSPHSKSRKKLISPLILNNYIISHAVSKTFLLTHPSPLYIHPLYKGR